MSNDKKPAASGPFEKAAKERKTPEEKDHDILVGKRIRKARVITGLTQQDLADKIGGIRFQQIQKYECGANGVSTYRLVQIAAALDRPITYFLPEKGKSQPSPTVISADMASKPS